MRLTIKGIKGRARIAKASRAVIEKIESRVLLTAFTGGNIAVLDLAAASNNTTGSILELNPSTAAQSTPVQTVPIAATGTNALRFSDSGTSSFLSRTNDGSLLAFGAYNTTDSTDSDLATVTASDPATDRAVGTLSNSGAFTLQTTYTGGTGNQVRSATSIDNSHWYIADKAGLYTNGATSASFAVNIGTVRSFGGTAYILSTRTAGVTSAISTAASPTATAVTGLPGVGTDAAIVDFYLIQSGNNGSTYDVLYTLDTKINKFSLVNGSWVSNGSYSFASGGGLGMIAANNGSGGASLFVTTSTPLAGNSLVKLTDNAGFNSAINVTTANNVTLYTATSPDTLKGLDFVPVAAGSVAPAITTNPTNQSVPAGQPVTFTAAASGIPAPTVQWYKGAVGSGTAISGATSNTLTFTTSLTASDNGTTYYAVFSNGIGTAASTTAASLTDTLATPLVTTQPGNQTVALGATATFTAAASGSPVPTVQWQVSTNGGTSYVNDTTDSGNTTNTLSVVGSATNNTYKYHAVYTNSQGSIASNAATLTVTTSVAIVTQPSSQAVSAGATVSLSSTASGSPTPTVQWKVSTNGGTTFTNIPGATSVTYTFVATESSSGYQYEAVFSNGTTSATSNAATVTVTGTPITEWDFTSGLAPTPQGSTTPGTGNSPFPSLAASSNDSANVLGMSNDYSGIQSFPEADILPIRSTVNPSFNQYVWRVRGGGGGGPTGSPGTPDGWSQYAPQYTQGVVFAVNTTGFSNITLNFNWSQGGVADMQAQYSGNGGSTWTNVGSVIQAATNDYYGVTPSSNPTGVLVNLQGIAAANNNPNFQLRLVSAYDPELPLIHDGNLDVNNGVGVHGQYASSGFGGSNNLQVVTLGDNNSFALTLNGQTTGTIAYSSDPVTMASNISAALALLSNVGSGNVGVVATDVTNTRYSITFQGNLKNTPEPTMTVSDSSDSVATWVYGASATTPTTTTTAPYTLTANSAFDVAVASVAGFTAFSPVMIGGISCIINSVGSSSINVTPQTSGSSATGATVLQAGVSRFVDGGGSWQLGNINFFGDQANGAPGVTSAPSAETVTGGTTASFTATVYSETTPTVQWQVNTGSSWVNVTTGTTTPTTFTNSPSNSYTSTYSFTTNVNLSDNGHQYRVVFTNASGSTTTTGATLTVVAAVAPSITTQPLGLSVQAGNPAIFTAAATGSPTPTIQWQVNTGSSWINLVDSPTVTGSTSTTLIFTTAADASQKGYQFRAVFTNLVNSVTSNAVTMKVLPTESIITDWDFASHSTVSPGTFDNSPAPTGGVVNVGTAIQVGMTRPYDPGDQATGIDGNGSVPAGDVTSTAGALNPNLSENTWRIRGGPTALTGGTPANGWSNFAPQYTQGAQFSVPTTGYYNAYVTMDWYSTTSGILDAQEQYSVSGNTSAITREALTSNVATLNANNSFAVGDIVSISGLAGPFNGTFEISAVTSTTFSYAVTAANVASTAVTGSAYDAIWTNINPQIQAVSNDFYGATAATATASITSESLSSNMATLTGANSFAVGNLVNVTGAGSPFNGQFTITAATSTSFSYALTAADVSPTAVSATAFVGGLPIPLVIDVSGIPGAINNPNFGVRLVSAYNQTLVDPNNGLHDEYANAALVGSPPGPAPYNGSKGNWRFDNIVFHGAAITPLAFSLSNYAVNENAGTATITVNRSGGTIGAATVHYATSNGTATAGTDYTATSGTLTISDGQASATFTIPIISVTAPAGTRTLNITLTSPSSNSSLGMPAMATVTITDNGSATAPTLSSSVLGDGTVQRSNISSIAVTFNAAVNFTASSFQLHKYAQNADGSINTGVAATDVSSGMSFASSDNITWNISVTAGGSLDRTGVTAAGFLGNGIYQLVLRGANITDKATGTAHYNSSADQILAFNSPEVGGPSNYFHALYGDWNGDGAVNNTDYFQFKKAYGTALGDPGFNSVFDFNGDASVNNTDYFQWKKVYGLSYSY